MTKKTVTYKNLAYCAVGHSAILLPVDHPGVSNRSMVRTSTVLSFDPASGVIETLNTIYKPLSHMEPAEPQLYTREQALLDIARIQDILSNPGAADAKRIPLLLEQLEAWASSMDANTVQNAKRYQVLRTHRKTLFVRCNKVEYIFAAKLESGYPDALDKACDELVAEMAAVRVYRVPLTSEQQAGLQSKAPCPA